MGERFGVRGRLTATAVAVAAAVMLVIGLGVSAFVGATFTDLARDSAEDRATAIAADLPGEGIVPVVDPHDEFVQILVDDVPVAWSASLAGLPPLDLPAPGTAVVLEGVPGGDGRFVAVSRTSGGRLVLVGRSLNDADEARSVLRRALLVALPIVLVAVGALSWWIVGRALRPVDRIRSEAARITVGDLHRRVPVPAGHDELSELAVTLNEMLARLERAARNHRRFVADASHELRSPVAAIQQHADVASAHPDAVTVEELVPAVGAEAARLTELVDDLVVLARLDEGAPARAVDVDLDDLVLEEVGRLRRSGVDVDATDVHAARVRGDPGNLRRLVTNLGANAARHARTGIRFSLRSFDDEVVLSVEDDGPGIPVGDRERALRRFVRLDEGRGREAGGSGLGLAIVDEVVRAHGGSISLLDANPTGLRAEVRLPVFTSDPVRDNIPRTRDEGGSS